MDQLVAFLYLIKVFFFLLNPINVFCSEPRKKLRKSLLCLSFFAKGKGILHKENGENWAL